MGSGRNATAPDTPPWTGTRGATSGEGLHFMVGGGIASLAAAVYLIRDAGVPGARIRIFDDQPRAGGALDGSGDLESGFLSRGGRMFEPHFANTFDLLSGIPSADDPSISAAADIMAFNTDVRASSRCRLLVEGRKADMEDLGLAARDLVAINRLLLAREKALSDRTIGSCFDRRFFESHFWIMWSTMFSFQPWHSAVEMRRYLHRFIHLLPGFTRIEGILRTRYNQYDSMVAPLVQWLESRGVRIDTGVVVKEICLESEEGARSITGFELAEGGHVAVRREDRVYLTLGSMTDGATYGSNTKAPSLERAPAPSWQLWQDLAKRHPGFGHPEVFVSEPERTAWTSFSVTMARSEFRDFMETSTGNRTGTGGLITLRDSGWLLSIVLFHQPHFRAQPEDTLVFWGYGLRGDRDGDFVAKPMWESTGDEIIRELCGQLRLTTEQAHWFDGARVIPCRMPFITSQFMPRKPGDRPATRPEGAGNFALMGQYVELPRDTVFTVEYSVRSARAAVEALMGCSAPIPVARTDRDPMVLLRAVRVLLGI